MGVYNGTIVEALGSITQAGAVSVIYGWKGYGLTASPSRKDDQFLRQD